MSLYRIWHPEVFQGTGRKKNYFEGWYYKLIDKGNTNVAGIIPGISLGESRDTSHAFIQIFDATNGETYYAPYPLSAFSSKKHVYEVHIGSSLFREDAITLKIQNADIHASADLRFDEIEKFPKSLFNPGIMGPFSFLPFMQCRHGIVNMRQRIHGNLTIGERLIDFEGGEGYVEKDWGTSFPSEWIWAQANHFQDPKTSFMFSVANIPFMGRKFRGLISFLLLGSRLYRFATYNSSKIILGRMDRESLQITLQNRHHTLSIDIRRAPGYLLKAPVKGRMDRVIEETIDAEVSLALYDRKGTMLFKGASSKCGLEITENAGSLLHSDSKMLHPV